MSLLRASSPPSLGRPLAVYRSRPLRGREVLGWLPLLFLSLGLLGYGLWRLYLGYAYYGAAAAQTWGKPWLLAAAASLLPLGLLLLREIRQRRGAVVLHENGLRLPSRQPPLPWPHLTGIASETTRYTLLGRPLHTRQRAWLYPATGRPIPLPPHLQNLPDLVARTKARLYPQLHPALRASLHRGEWLYFGPVRLHRAALAAGKREYPWARVQNVSLARGQLQIDLQPHGLQPRRARIPAARIPNVELLLQLIDEDILA